MRISEEKQGRESPLYASITTLPNLSRHPQNELFQRRLVPGILKPGPLRLDSRIGIAPSHIHGFLHVPPYFFLGDVVVTGNLADDAIKA